jgi:hypothetical protein
VVLQLPWEFMTADVAPWVFLRGLEYACGFPGRIRLEWARLEAEEAQHRADEIEAKLRSARAGAQLELLGRLETRVGIEDGVLRIE